MLYRSHKRVTRRQIGGLSSYDSVYQPTFTPNYDTPVQDYYHQNVSLPDMTIRQDSRQVMKDNFITNESYDPINITSGYYYVKPIDNYQYGGKALGPLDASGRPESEPEPYVEKAPREIVSSNRPQPQPQPQAQPQPQPQPQPRQQDGVYLTQDMKDYIDSGRRSDSDPNILSGFTETSKDTLQTLQSTNQLSGVISTEPIIGLSSVLPSVVTVPITSSISNSSGEQYQKDLKQKEEETAEIVPDIEQQLQPVGIMLKAGEALGELAINITNPETIPISSLFSSFKNDESASETLKNFGESIPEAFAAGALGRFAGEAKAAKIASIAGKVGTLGVISSSTAQDIKEGKKAGVVLANTGLKLAEFIPGGTKGTKLAKGITGLKIAASIGQVVAPFTFDKSKEELEEAEPEKKIKEQEEKERQQEKDDDEIRRMLNKNDPNKVYTDKQLDIIQGHVDRGNTVSEFIKQQLDDKKAREAEPEEKEQEEQIKETVEEEEQKINKYSYEVVDQPVLIDYPDYSGQVETYTSMNLVEPQSIDCSKLKGRQRERCEKQKLLIEARKKQKSKRIV